MQNKIHDDDDLNRAQRIRSTAKPLAKPDIGNNKQQQQRNESSKLSNKQNRNENMNLIEMCIRCSNKHSHCNRPLNT